MKNIFDAIPHDLDAEIFQDIVKNDHVTIERIISKGHTSPETGWYDQEHNEWVIVLRGAAELQFDDGTSVKLKSGDFINIAAKRKHKVTWTDPDLETVWLAIHY